MTNIETGSTVLNFLRKHFNLPSEIRSLTLHCNMDDVCNIDVNYLPRFRENESAINQRFDVVPVPALPSNDVPTISSCTVIDDEKDEITIYGIRYSGGLFRGLGFGIDERQTFQIIGRDEGLITISTTRTDAIDIAKDAERFRWLLNGNGYFLEEEGVCGHAPCGEAEQDDARARIDKAMAEDGCKNDD